jgi:hypothetical protein
MHLAKFPNITARSDYDRRIVKPLALAFADSCNDIQLVARRGGAPSLASISVVDLLGQRECLLSVSKHATGVTKLRLHEQARAFARRLLNQRQVLRHVGSLVADFRFRLQARNRNRRLVTRFLRAHIALPAVRISKGSKNPCSAPNPSVDKPTRASEKFPTSIGCPMYRTLTRRFRRFHPLSVGHRPKAKASYPRPRGLELLGRKVRQEPGAVVAVDVFEDLARAGQHRDLVPQPQVELEPPLAH